MNRRSYPPPAFKLRSLVVAALPAYVFPTLMSFLPGYFMKNKELMMASYTTIGLPSLLSTIASFILLWQLESRHILAQHKWIRSLLIVLLMTILGTLCTSLLHLESERFNITCSAFLGAAILTIRQQLNNNDDEKL